MLEHREQPEKLDPRVKRAKVLENSVYSLVEKAAELTNDLHRSVEEAGAEDVEELEPPVAAKRLFDQAEFDRIPPTLTREEWDEVKRILSARHDRPDPTFLQPLKDAYAELLKQNEVPFEHPVGPNTLKLLRLFHANITLKDLSAVEDLKKHLATRDASPEEIKKALLRAFPKIDAKTLPPNEIVRKAKELLPTVEGLEEHLATRDASLEEIKKALLQAFPEIRTKTPPTNEIVTTVKQLGMGYNSFVPLLKKALAELSEQKTA